jgi:hypothetical protein
MKLYESIFILKRYEEWIAIRAAIMAGLNYHKHGTLPTKEHTIHYVTLYNSIVVDVCSFKDEYNNYFLQKSEPEFTDRIKVIRKIAKPAMALINSWSELNDFRNMIAHPWRDEKTGNFSLAILGTLNAPKNFRDLLGMLTCIQIVVRLIAHEFDDHTKHVWPYIDAITNESNISTRFDEYETLIHELIETINNNCKIQNRQYQLEEPEIMRFAVYDLKPV